MPIPYQLTITEKSDYLLAEVSGERIPGQEAENALKFWGHIVELCKAKGFAKMLVITNLTGRLPASEAFKIGDSAFPLGWDRHFKVAYVDLNADSLEDNLFSETVAFNRGINAKVFGNVKEAKSWLQKN